MSVVITHSHLSDKLSKTNSFVSDNSHLSFTNRIDSLLSEKLFQTNKTNLKSSDNSFQTNPIVSNLFKFKALLPLSINSLIKLLVLLIVPFFLINCGGGGGSSNSNTTVTTNAVTPTITVQPIDAIYTEGDTPTPLSVTASVTDGGTLSYQWYSNTVNSNTNGDLISGAAQSTYTPSTTNAGTLYYYVIVTNTNNNVNGNKTAGITSSTAQITVEAPVITHLINFYDENLDFIEAIPVNEGIINPSDIKSGSWYKAGDDTVLTNHNLTESIILYAASNVTEITDQTGLDNIRNNLSGKYILMNDINLNETEAGFESTGWNAIGNNTAAYRFNGTINGNGYKITNLWISKTTNYQGLFGYISNAQIRNLGVEIAEGKSVNGGSYTGGIAGYVLSSNISNVYVIGSINGSGISRGGIAGYFSNSTIIDSHVIGNIHSSKTGEARMGGIVGRVAGGSNAIINSYFIGNISGTGNYFGGIAGSVESGSIADSHAIVNINMTGQTIGGIVGTLTSSSVVDNSYVIGNISGNATSGSYNYGYVGGIVGSLSSYSNITNSYMTGEISSSAYAGGIAGQVGSYSIIASSYSTANVNGTERLGGIAGYVYTNNATIINAYATGNISGTGNYVGGISGYIFNAAAIVNTYTTGSVSGTDQVGGIAGLIANVGGVSVVQNNAAINPSVNGATNTNRIAGVINANTVSNNFALNTMSVTGTVNGAVGTDKTIGQFKTKSTYSDDINGDGNGGLGWSFGDNDTSPWKIDANKNNGLPYLYWQEL
ncbi:MAG: hypothetical protein LBB59_02395 [Campylobacteraceae bacterium]|jgi:hypothetical protein|nr:hypothetical protein [Campylobacteraceae bacterium]